MSEIQKRLDAVINNFGIDSELALKLSVMRDQEVVKEQRDIYESYKNRMMS